MTAPWIQQLYLDPIAESRRVGVRYGDFVVIPFLLPAAGGPDEGRSARQLAELFGVLEATLDVAGEAAADLVRVTLYLREVTERAAADAALSEAYPEVARKLAAAPLPPGVEVALGAVALRGTPRGEVLDLLDAP